MWCVLKFIEPDFIMVEFSNGEVKTFEKIGSVMLDKFLISFGIHEPENFEPAKVVCDVEGGVLYLDDVFVVYDNEFMITKNFVISITKLNKKNCL